MDEIQGSGKSCNGEKDLRSNYERILTRARYEIVDTDLIKLVKDFWKEK